jgi:DNA mismatch endonuclease, patch repair protein
VAQELPETVQFAMKEHASKSSTPTSERKRVLASYAGFHPASPTASRIAAKASRKRGTKCEVKLRQALRKLGLKFTMNDSSLSGCPDLVFKREKVAIFADGDFWHGRKLAIRIATLSTGHNSSYWIQKIQSNVIRDRAVTRQLRALGWRVIRIWESQINSDIDRATARIANAVSSRFQSSFRGVDAGASTCPAGKRSLRPCTRWGLDSEASADRLHVDR